MKEDILKKLAVRIKILRDDNKDRAGSGVIVKNKSGEYFVITAEHCIHGKKDDRLEKIKNENIVIQHKYHKEDNFKRLKVEGIQYRNVDEDIMVLKIPNLNGRADCISYGKFNSLDFEECMHFRGYPKLLSDEAQNYKCSFKSGEKYNFKIKAEDIEDMTLRKGAEDTAGGLSGSGLFLIRGNVPYLIGIITNIAHEKATFGHIVCQRLDSIFNIINIDSTDLSSFESLTKWNVNLKKNNIESKIATLKKNNTKEFEHLEKKCRILYEEDANEMIQEILFDYYEAELILANIMEKNQLLQNTYMPIFFERFRKRVKRTFDKKKVANSNEAKEIYESVIKLFCDLFKEDYPHIPSRDFDQTVTKLLLDCDLNFIKL